MGTSSPRALRRRGEGQVRRPPTIPTGIVHIDDQTVNNDADVPFGGIGAPGLGRIGDAAANIEAFTHTRWITMRGEPASYPS